MQYVKRNHISKVGERGQVTIPKELRDRYGVRPGQEMVFEEHADGLLVRKITSGDPLRSLLGAVRARIDVDDYLAEARGEGWSSDLD